MKLLINNAATFTTNCSNNIGKSFFEQCLCADSFHMSYILFSSWQTLNVIDEYLFCTRHGARLEWEGYVNLNKALVCVLREDSCCSKGLGSCWHCHSDFFSQATWSVEDSKTHFAVISWELTFLFISKDWVFAIVPTPDCCPLNLTLSAQEHWALGTVWPPSDS